ncbi:MAG: septal ring lytic transglycosylase RlpA family protein [Proteobacteria bacterium]|uniref:septal ring lytic transglycosylase RlpA family protein n=1 Tax=Rudaea sp. TaxID=2136325 RepID=UPI0037850118|nr:septal ring lytic transglycosylase RlpA family protein [Pseudomonadota bacterium]
MSARASAGLLRAGVAAGLLLIAGCGGYRPVKPSSQTRSRADDTSRPQSSRYAQNDDSGPGGALPDVSRIPEPVPRAEPRSAYGNKSPYAVLGKTYNVLPNASGYVERGIASWYGNKFHGYTTSNFEKYDMYAFSAAHKTLPLPSYARVTNLDNGASVIVRVNDRGPFAENRVIDLSYVAAIKLGIWQKGTGLVEVRAIDPEHPERDLAARSPARPAPAAASPPRIAAAPPPGKIHKPALYLQVGAFSDQVNAERAAETLRGARLGTVRVVEGASNGRAVRRVRIGPLRDADEADALAPKVRALGLGEPRVAIDD